MALIPTTLLVEAYAKHLGTEQSQHLIDEAVVEIGLRRAAGYSRDDFLRIIDHLKAKGGITMVVAAGVASRVILSREYE